MNEYDRALKLLVRNEKEIALSILTEILNTEILDEATTPQIRDGRSRPMFFLKYSCFKNVASIHADMENYQDAIHYYLEAAILDNTDVVLWYKIGTMAAKISSLDIACIALKHGLKQNQNHWPSLDSIITILYAIPDYMNCLLYISIALQIDPMYIKGLTFRKKIFENIPCLTEYYEMYDSVWMNDFACDNARYKVISMSLINEADELKKNWIKTSTAQILQKPFCNLLLKPLTQYSWLELGNSLIEMHRYINNNNLNFTSYIIINISEQSNSNSNDNMSESCSLESVRETREPEILVRSTARKPVLDRNISVSENNCFCSIEHDSSARELNELENEHMTCTIKDNVIEDENPNRHVVHEYNVKESNRGDLKSSDDKNHYYGSTEVCNDNVWNVNQEKINYEMSEKFHYKNSKRDENSSNLEENKNEKLKKRRRSSLCFLTQWAWSSSDIKRSPRAKTSIRRGYERDGLILEKTLKQIFPPTLL